MSMIKERYGKQVIVNLLGTSVIGSKEGEATLSHDFQVHFLNNFSSQYYLYIKLQKHHKESNHNDIPHVVFDYHQECRGGNQTNLSKLKTRVDQYLQEFGFFHAEANNVYRYVLH